MASAFVATADVSLINDPATYDEAIKSQNADDQLRAMESELQSLKKNKTQQLTKLPLGRKILRGKWVYKTKIDAAGKPCRYKARWVVKGFI